ncbi:winged helix-turn-helix domain-containing protein [Streptomyces sp. enrichment culture]|uniref:winged helix-turn-helix domain-containing protein n=1 Tax=Streptomyces sp. enrichment culture TaxID=1795815 RepID=UPI003F57C061
MDPVADQDAGRAPVPQELHRAQGVAGLLKRHGWSRRVPARRAIGRDEDVVAGWVKGTRHQVEGPWRRSTPGSSPRTKPASR